MPAFLSLDEPYVGLIILILSYFVSRFFYRHLYKKLNEEHRLSLANVNGEFKLFRFAPIILLLIYMFVQWKFADYKAHTFLMLWVIYNLFLFFHIRWVLKAYKEVELPPNFVQGWMQSKIIFYVGVISSLLVLYEGGHFTG